MIFVQKKKKKKGSIWYIYFRRNCLFYPFFLYCPLARWLELELKPCWKEYEKTGEREKGTKYEELKKTFRFNLLKSKARRSGNRRRREGRRRLRDRYRLRLRVAEGTLCSQLVSSSARIGDRQRRRPSVTVRSGSRRTTTEPDQIKDFVRKKVCNIRWITHKSGVTCSHNFLLTEP